MQIPLKTHKVKLEKISSEMETRTVRNSQNKKIKKKVKDTMNKFIISVFTQKGLPYLLCRRQHMMLTAGEWQPLEKKQHKIKSNKTLLGTTPRRYYAKAVTLRVRILALVRESLKESLSLEKYQE